MRAIHVLQTVYLGWRLVVLDFVGGMDREMRKMFWPHFYRLGG
jgi:hypothetical protein